MTIENLKQIAIKYAITKGSRVPLAPDELCNAVVQYFNEFLKITADINTIQVAVTEEGGNIVFTITGNTLDGKAFTPIVITVDHNDFVTNQEFEAFKTSVTKQLNNKRSVISSPASSYVVYTQANGLESNLPYSELANQTSTNIMARRANGTSDVKKGISGENVANMENIAEINSTLDNKLDKVSSTTGVPQVYVKEYNGTQTMLDLSESTRVNSIPKRSPSGRMYAEAGVISDPSSVATMRNIAAVESKIPDISNLATTEQLQEVENKIPDTSNLVTKTELQEVESKIPDTTNFAGVTKTNTFTGVNTFNNTIYAKNGVVAVDTTNYGANSIRKGPNTYSFPNKSGTFAMTTDVIKEPIYFISFYANEPSETCHLIGTMMSKNSYGTGQKTNEEFAVMLADNLYTNSNEGLAAYGKLAGKDILCIYSEDGLSIRCLDEANSEVDLPTVMFFVMETEL